MWYTPYEVSVWKRVGKYLLRVVLLLWIIVSFVVGYFYLLATGSQEDRKGGTFVEGIFDEVSYLPYLKTDDQSVFYQKFLFQSCLDSYNLEVNTFEDGSNLAEGLCRVYTNDNQNYVLRLVGSAVWSDGTPVTIEDIFFTYDEILRKNVWNIQSLNVWNQITVSLEDDRVKVSFPTVSMDNINFFTNALLPKHSLENSDLDYYKSTFSQFPVTNGCATIVPKTSDVNSLIFDLNGCDDTKFAYYQVKNYGSFEEFEDSLRGKYKKSMVDVYTSIYGLEGFTGQDILTSKLLGIFFNTDSGKSTVRLRRSIGGLIAYNFFTGGYEKYIDKYDGDFLNNYLSEGENVVDLINRLNLSNDDSIDTDDLKDSGAKELPTSMSINGVDRKFVFFIEKPKNARDLEIKFSNEFSDIKIKSSANGAVWSVPKNYNPKDKKLTYTLKLGENLNVGVNNFTISGFIKNKTYTIASIDIYVFENINSNDTDNEWKLSVLYYYDPVSVFTVQRMREIFSEAGILDHFVFEPVYNAEELEGKFVVGTYDVYVGMVDLGSRNDVLNLFATEDPKLNPSRYRNPILTSMISQYRRNYDRYVQGEINFLLAQEMPVVLLGNVYDTIQVQEKIKNTVFADDESGNKKQVYANRWRYDIYSKYSIVHGVRVDSDKALNIDNFKKYMLSNLFPEIAESLEITDNNVQSNDEEAIENVENNGFEESDGNVGLGKTIPDYDLNYISLLSRY